jgi:hypothetical protein
LGNVTIQVHLIYLILKIHLGGESAGFEADFGAGLSYNIGKRDNYQNSLISIDGGIGPGLGGSVNIRSYTYMKRLF